MNFSAFKTQFQSMKEKNPVWFALESDPPASELDVVRAENELQIAFPSEYRDFVKEFGGGYFALANVFSVCRESDWNIVQKNKQYALAGFIAASENGVGDFFGFRVVSQKCLPEIWFLDHEEHGQLKSTSYANLWEFLAERGLKSKPD